MGSRGSLVAQQPQRVASTPPQPQQNSTSTHHRRAFSFRQRPQPMSDFSSPQVPDSGWTGQNFLLGAGMVVIQPSTTKVVVLYESEKKYWFLPKGRKDVGESLEQTALREAYEESGYQVEFLPLYNETRAPGPPDDRYAAVRPNCEPVYISTAAYPARVRGNRVSPAGEYLTFWYVGQIPPDAVREEGTGMPDEVNYQAHLMDVKEALKLLFEDEAIVVRYAWELFCWTQNRLQEEERKRRARAASESESTSSPNPTA